MPASISLHNLSYSTPDGRSLFTDLDLTFGPGRTGLIGRNGTGKSSLLRLIAGELSPQSGTIGRHGSIGMLRQAVQHASQTVADALGVGEALSRLARLERGQGSLDDSDAADWLLPSRIADALATCRLPVLEMDRPLATLSGGQGTRLALAALLVVEPDVILLDEPTNNLDADGRDAVAQLLDHWRGAAIVVSHDRSLLAHMDAIVELTSIGASLYGGNWDHYSAQKALEKAAAEHRAARTERKVTEIDRKIQLQSERKARRDAAGSRKAARGGIPRIMVGGMKDNAERTSGENARLASRQRSDAAQAAAEAQAELEILTPLSVQLAPAALPAGRTVVSISGLTGGPDGDNPVIRNFDLTITGPERIAITGSNGSGKTTLLRLLTGELTPIEGMARILVPYALLDQTVSLLDPARDIRDNVRALNPDADENTIRAALARFMFRADAALQIVGTLSGGELLRAALAATMGGANPPQLLILDEPTNHLDIYAIQELEAGLRRYDGGLLVVSHDRAFLQAIEIDRTIDLNNLT